MTAKSIQSRSASYRLLAEVMQNDIGLEDASSELQDDRDVVLHCVRRCPAAIKHASARLRGDKEIILAAATGEYGKWNSDTVLNVASTELQDDREVVLHCVKNGGEAIKHASARLRGDKEIILAAATGEYGKWNYSATVLNLASTELQDDREVVLHCVKNGGEAIKHASARLRGDKEIILAAATGEYGKWNSYTVLSFASTELQDDRDVVLHCVKNDGYAIEHASARLRADKEIILAAARGLNSTTVLKLASTELQDDRDVVLHCVKNDGKAIKHASARLRGDKEIILAWKWWRSDNLLSFASTELQDDREVVLHCVKNDGCHDGYAIKHASARLRGDKEIILAAARKGNSATVLSFASTELQDDREVVLHCVENDGDAIKHASARLRGDKEIILAAARKWNSDTVLSFASTELQDDREVVLHCVKNGRDAIKHASARLRGDKEIILAAAGSVSDTVLDLASAELQDDREVVLHCVKNAMNKGNAIKHASARLRGDKEIILAAAEKWQSATVLNLASSELQDDREVVLHCVKNNGDAIKHASARLRGDKEIILAAARERNSDTVLSFASTELQDDREVVLRCVELIPDAIYHASSRLRGDKEIILAAEEARANLFQNEIILAAEEARANLEPTFFQNDY